MKDKGISRGKEDRDPQITQITRIKRKGQRTGRDRGQRAEVAPVE
jgi:hypothetical protein